MSVLPAREARFDWSVPVAVVGAGGCGLCAGLAARQAGAEVLILERDAVPIGTTGMSTGLIPGAGTRMQREKGIEDSPELFAEDLLAKAKHQTDADVVLALARESARTVEWLAGECGVALSLVDSFLYSGHSVKRMHGSPNRTGAELMGTLLDACTDAGADLLTDARVSHLFADADGRISGLRCVRPDGSTEDLGCEALILACCGFAGNQDMVAEYIPELRHAEFFGHPGNQGEAIRWGRELGAAIADIGSYQGHGGLAKGYGVPILWPVILEGGIQVNLEGRRFSDESIGYSEQAMEVLAQPEHVAVTVYDQRLHELMHEFNDYREAITAGAVREASTPGELAELFGLPAGALEETLAETAALTRGEASDPFGRDFTGRPELAAPWYGVRVTGALFHTQGGLRVDARARVLREDGSAFPNLFAGGGAARGVSGPSRWGYIAGNGLLTATTYGRLAGETAAALP
ncbi:MAG: FAD-dependent oxidoreductase [Gammaproteobacteria bacterium]|nr:FAD-dependent oxidoreductase [Gammaproteobacteria bacterium]